MPYAACPGCDENVYIAGKPKMGQKITCKECEARLVVISTDPLELDFPYEDEREELDDEDD